MLAFTLEGSTLGAAFERAATTRRERREPVTTDDDDVVVEISEVEESGSSKRMRWHALKTRWQMMKDGECGALLRSDSAAWKYQSVCEGQ